MFRNSSNRKTIFNIFSIIFIMNFVFADPCEMDSNTLYLSGSDVWYNSSSDIGGFQFNVDGASVDGASGGDAAAAGFTVSAGGSTVLGFSFTGSTIPAGCGTLTSLSLNGDATGLSGIVISDPFGVSLDFEYYEGGDDCASGYYDECGVCDGDGIPDGDCDCDGSVFDECNVCGGTGVDADGDGVCDDVDDCVGAYDECGVCNGDGAIYDCGCEGFSDCWDGSQVCDLTDCPFEPHFVVDIGETGESTLFIFQDSISTLEAGDQLGIFDQAGIVDDQGNTGEILVGAGFWEGDQLNLAAISSVDLSDFGGPILPGSVSGHAMTLKVWKASEEIEYDVSYTIDSGSGTFNGLFTAIDEISFCEIPEGACDCDGNVLDECGVCGGPGSVYECGCSDIADGDCDCDGNVEDCLGDCGGDAFIDECGECNGDGIDEGACDCDGNVEDCLGDCGGDAVVDECGVCDGDGIDEGAGK